jgi:hypothetical protein
MLNNTKLYTVNASDKSSFLFEAGGSSNNIYSKRSRSPGYLTTSSIDGGSGNSMNQGGFNTSATVVGKTILTRYLDGFIPDNLNVKRQLYSDMYYHDIICGSAVDILSSIPFSSFDVVGIADLEILEKYQKCCEALRPGLLLPSLSKEYMVMGLFIGTTLFDENENIFTAIMPQDLNQCTIKNIPIYGVDPLITLNINAELKKLVKDKDPRVQNIMNDLPENVKEAFKKGSLDLAPETTIYLPRRSLPSDTIGTSYYERALSIYLIEKTLYRGTLDQISRRQRSILHITLGDSDEWIPDQQDLNNVSNLFSSADADPTGPIIVTRSGVNPSEIRQAEDFFRYDSIFDFASTAKYRALGVSEEMISGQLSISTMDAALSITMDQLRDYRAMMTREIFYEKIFPAVAIANSYKKDGYTTLGSSRGYSGDKYDKNNNRNRIYKKDGVWRATASDSPVSVNIKSRDFNLKEYLIPRIEWEKHLKAEGDSAYMQLLDELGQKGVPIPLTMLATAAGVSMDSILNSKDADLELRKVMADYSKEIQKYNKKAGLVSESKAMQMLGALNYKPGLKTKGLLNREYSDEYQPHEVSKSGKKKSTSKRRQRELREAANRLIAQSAAKAAQEHNRRVKDKKKSKTMLHNRLGIIK